MTNRYKTIRTRGGSVIQAGLDLRHRSDPLSAATPRLGIYRGLVLKTFVPRSGTGEKTGDVRRGNQIECDVLLIRNHSILLKAPVIQRAFGVNEAHAPWIPKPAKRTLDGTPLNFQVMSQDGNFEAVATSFENTDGDMVMVQFVEGNPDYPVITGALTHERTNRLVRDGAGWTKGQSDQGSPYQDEYYVHHQGTEIRINATGDLLIDTVGAYSDRSTEDPGASVGNIRLRIKDGQRFTIAMGNDEDVFEIHKSGGQVRVDLGEGATERVVLGDSFQSFLDGFIDKHNSHTHPYLNVTTAATTSAVLPVEAQLPMDDSLLSDLAKTKKS